MLCPSGTARRLEEATRRFRAQWEGELRRGSRRFGSVDRSRLDFELCRSTHLAHGQLAGDLTAILQWGSPNVGAHRNPDDYARRTARGNREERGTPMTGQPRQSDGASLGPSGRVGMAWAWGGAPTLKAYGDRGNNAILTVCVAQRACMLYDPLYLRWISGRRK